MIIGELLELGAGAGLDAPARRRERNLVNLVNYCATRISVRVRGRLNLVDFSPAAEPGVFFYYRKIRKELKNTETFLRDGEGGINDE